LLWFSEVPGYDYRCLIAGNHDELVRDMGYNEMRQICHTLGIIYLQDSGVEIEGVKIWVLLGVMFMEIGHLWLMILN